jgi:hypothetical protein
MSSPFVLVVLGTAFIAVVEIVARVRLHQQWAPDKSVPVAEPEAAGADDPSTPPRRWAVGVIEDVSVGALGAVAAGALSLVLVAVGTAISYGGVAIIAAGGIAAAAAAVLLVAAPLGDLLRSDSGAPPPEDKDA